MLPGVTFAQAQTTGSTAPTLPRAITPEEHNAVTKGGTIKSGMGSTLGEGTIINTSLGWHYQHATYCNAYFDGTTNWVYVYPSEGGYWFTSLKYFGNTFINQCVLGNWVAVYVTDTAGDFNQVYTYDYK